MVTLVFCMMIGTMFLGYSRKVSKRRIYTFLFPVVVFSAYLIIPKNESFVPFLLVFVGFFVFGFFIPKLSHLFISGIGSRPDGEPEE